MSRDPSPSCSTADPLQKKKSYDHDEEDFARRKPHHSHRSPGESPVDPVFGSVRHNRPRPPQSPIFPVESTYSPGRIVPDSVPPDPQKSRGHCQRNLPDALYHQTRQCPMEEQRYRKHEERSTSPTSSSDAAEVFTRPRHQRSRHRHMSTCKESHYQSAIPQVHYSPSGRHRQENCHRYHEIEKPHSCSPICDSGIKEDDGSSSAPSNNRDRFSSCEDVSGGNVQTNLHGQIPGHDHRMSSGISCESSTSTPSMRNHGMEHCVSERHRNHVRHNHGVQAYALDHQRVQIAHAETKSPLLIGLEAIQIAAAPGKNKCQCHMDHMQQQEAPDQMQQNHQMHHHRNLYHEHEGFGQDKRNGDGDDNADNRAVVARIHQPPALPPRPPPRPNRRYEPSAYDNRADNGEGGCCKKYVVLCCLCGGLSAAVGSLFLAVHAVLSAHTASLMHFETVPSYIPGTMLILMGLFTMLLARRKHRYGLLMKVCGSVGVVCALVCVLVTVTTTVIHMSKLQGLRECVYTARARSCTCYGASQGRGADTGVLFEGTPHCEAVHGALYACLRALFGVSVAGILACIFSCMLVYQLLSHEKKKMYWEQLELRCRSLYGQGGGAPVGTTAGSCGCCNDCGGANPWWAQTPGNLYTPNPDMAPSRRWRLPWSRSRGPAPSPDSNYGFHAQSLRHANDISDPNREAPTIPAPYGFIDSRQTGPYSVLNPQNTSYSQNTASYNVLETPVPLWGPPPPYSDPNSPARRPQIVEPKSSSSGSSASSATVTAVAPTPSRLATAKRTDNFETEDHHLQRAPHCPISDNYENTEEIAPVDLECSGHENTIKPRRSRRALKGVENDGFQQENQLSATKQSESELYFGDVSSCCGPESSLYEMAVEKEMNSRVEHQPEEMQKDYLVSRMSKHRLSKRSRLPLPLPPPQGSPHQEAVIDAANERSYSNGDESVGSSGAFLAPDAQYEVIRQGVRYGYYSKEEEFCENSYGFYRDPAENEGARERKEEENHEKSARREHCCSNSVTDLDADWQGEQKLKDDGVCPINV